MTIREPSYQATEELHSRIAAGGAGRGAQLPTPAAAELLDDAELLVDDREIDADLTGNIKYSIQLLVLTCHCYVCMKRNNKIKCMIFNTV